MCTRYPTPQRMLALMLAWGAGKWVKGEGSSWFLRTFPHHRVWVWVLENSAGCSSWVCGEDGSLLLQQLSVLLTMSVSIAASRAVTRVPRCGGSGSTCFRFLTAG